MDSLTLDWNQEHLAKFQIFWKTLLRCDAADKDDLLYIMEWVEDEQVQARAWTELYELGPTRDELLYILEWTSQPDIRWRAWIELYYLGITADDCRYIIKWIPDYKFDAGKYWTQLSVNSDEIRFIGQNVPELSGTLLRLVKQIEEKRKKLSGELFVRGFGR